MEFKRCFIGLSYTSIGPQHFQPTIDSKKCAVLLVNGSSADKYTSIFFSAAAVLQSQSFTFVANVFIFCNIFALKLKKLSFYMAQSVEREQYVIRVASFCYSAAHSITIFKVFQFSGKPLFANFLHISVPRCLYLVFTSFQLSMRLLFQDREDSSYLLNIWCITTKVKVCF